MTISRLLPSEPTLTFGTYDSYAVGRLERWSAYFHRIILSPLIDTYPRRKPTHEEIQDLPVLFAIVEESGLGKRCCFSCVGCRGGRPIRLHVVEEGTDKQVEINKPCRLGGWICSPLEMTVSDTRKSEDVKLGLVKQNFQPYCSRCYEDACRCTFYTDVRTSRTPCTQATKSVLFHHTPTPSTHLSFSHQNCPNSFSLSPARTFRCTARRFRRWSPRPP